MADTPADPFGMNQVSKDLFTAQRTVLSSGKIFEQISEAAGIVSAAQMAYGQALMRANSLLFAAFLQPASGAQDEIGPSLAVKQANGI